MHAYNWQFHCKKAQGTQVGGAGDRLRIHYMFLPLPESRSLLNPERAPHGLETLRGAALHPQLCPRCCDKVVAASQGTTFY